MGREIVYMRKSWSLKLMSLNYTPIVIVFKPLVKGIKPVKGFETTVTDIER